MTSCPIQVPTSVSHLMVAADSGGNSWCCVHVTVAMRSCHSRADEAAALVQVLVVELLPLRSSPTSPLLTGPVIPVMLGREPRTSSPLGPRGWPGGRGRRQDLPASCFCKHLPSNSSSPGRPGWFRLSRSQKPPQWSAVLLSLWGAAAPSSVPQLWLPPGLLPLCSPRPRALSVTRHLVGGAPVLLLT